MKTYSVGATALLCAAGSLASLVPVGPVPFSGTGLGSVNTVLTLGDRPVESGCVARGPAGDIVGPAACPPGFAGGDERTGASQTLTRTIAELGLTTAFDLRIVLNVNESTGNSATLNNLALTIYSPAGAVLFTTGAFIAPTFALTHSPGTTVGYVFELDAAQAAQAQLVFAPTNRVGLAATLSNATAGPETFYVADVTAIGVPILGADLAVTKTAAATVIAGSNLTYTLNAINNGPEAAANVVISDPLPAGTRFVSLTAPAGWTCSTPAAGGTGTISCTKASMAILETASFTAVVRTCPELACGSSIVNTAAISSATLDPVTANSSSTATTTVQAQSDVAITKAASAGSVNPGGTIIYTLNVTNAGPSNSAGTTVADTLPAGFTAVNATTTSGTCSGVGTSTVSCTLGTIGATGQCATAFPTAATITITAQIAAGAATGSYTNTATVATANCLADPNLANNTATIVTTIPASPVDADVAITKIAPATVVAGTNLTYGLTVSNAGPQPAASVTVSDPLPAEMRFVSQSAPAGWTCTTPPVGGTGTITCTKPVMAVAESAVFTTVTTVCPETLCGATLTNTATATSSTADPVPANNASTATVSVQAQSDLAIAKSASAAALNPGDTLTYMLNVMNAGPSNSAGTAVVDTLPAGFTVTNIVSTTGTCSGVGTSTVTCNLGVMGAPAQCTTGFPIAAMISITAQLSAAAAAGTAVNTATVSTANCLADPNAANNTATLATPIIAGAAAGVPTLTEWGLIVFGALLLLAGLYFVRV